MENLLPDVEKALAIIKPADVRVQNWSETLTSLFVWEEKALREVSNIDISKYMIENPTIADILLLKEMDDKMKELSKLSTLKKNERKEVTSNIDGMKTRLMITENAYQTLSEKIKPYYIKISKVKQAEEEKTAKRTSDLNSFRSRMQISFNESVAASNLYIQAKVTESYKECLAMIEPEDLDGYLSNLLSLHKSEAFGYKQPTVTQAEVDDEEKVAIYQEIFGKWNHEGFSQSFKSILTNTFSDFTIAKQQSDEAIRQREAEQSIEVLEIQDNVEVENTIAVLEEKSAPTMSFAYEKTRELKKVYELDMVHDENNMRRVNKAFYANMKECLAVYQGKDYWKIDTVTQGELLSKLKNKDNGIIFEGIVFKETDKI